MGFTTIMAFDPANSKPERTTRRFYLTLIITMNYKASGAATGTGELMKPDAVNTGIVKALR